MPRWHSPFLQTLLAERDRLGGPGDATRPASNSTTLNLLGPSRRETLAALARTTHFSPVVHQPFTGAEPWSRWPSPPPPTPSPRAGHGGRRPAPSPGPTWRHPARRSAVPCRHPLRHLLRSAGPDPTSRTERRP